MNKVQKHKDICNELNEIYDKKQHDYGDSFGQTFDKLGIISAVTRISDKYNRLVSLATKPEEERKVKDESITDTLLDMANYCIMTVIEMHKDENVKMTIVESHKDNNNENKDKDYCKHDWQYLSTQFDTLNNTLNNFRAPIEIQRCTKCGATRQLEIIGL